MPVGHDSQSIAKREFCSGHSTRTRRTPLVKQEPFGESSRKTLATWRAYLDAGVAESQLTAIRRSTYSGRPRGSQEFTRTLEKETKRRLTPQKRGPRKKADRSENQETFSFGAQLGHLCMVEPFRLALAGARHFRWWLFRPGKLLSRKAPNARTPSSTLSSHASQL